MRITRKQLKQIIKEAIDVMNSETGELMVFSDKIGMGTGEDWYEGMADAPEAAAGDSALIFALTQPIIFSSVKES